MQFTVFLIILSGFFKSYPPSSNLSQQMTTVCNSLNKGNPQDGLSNLYHQFMSFLAFILTLSSLILFIMEKVFFLLSKIHPSTCASDYLSLLSYKVILPNKVVYTHCLYLPIPHLYLNSLQSCYSTHNFTK